MTVAMVEAYKTDELLELSRCMLQAAAEQEWEQVQEFERAREQLLADYDAAADLALGRERLEASLQEILEINRRIVEFSIEARDDIRENLETLQRGIKAGHAYHQNK